LRTLRELFVVSRKARKAEQSPQSSFNTKGRMQQSHLAILLAGSWARAMLNFVRRMGGLGLFAMGILDSSFLFLPFGNDLLLIAMVSAERNSLKWILYVLMSAAGSVVGVWIIDVVMRKMGEEGLERFVKPDKVKRLKSKMEKHAGWAVFIATLIPPPFPFTAVVLTSSALQCSRKKMLLAVFVGRLIRFTVEALLAIRFGRQVLKLMESDVIDYLVYSFLVIAIVGSIFSVRKWVGSRRARPAMQHGDALN
jgi:membrane protein YqaA with SNARE-associated domain